MFLGVCNRLCSLVGWVILSVLCVFECRLIFYIRKEK